MASLWEYLTKPVDGGYKPDVSYADMTLHNATIVPRFIARTGKSVYDSFKRGITPLQLGEDPYLRREQAVEDAFNVASAAMVGGTPGVPKGNSPSTLGMAFRRPKDVVFTPRGEYNPLSSTLKEDLGSNYDLYQLINRYHNKTWGTENDQVIKHISKGYDVPNIPGLDSEKLNELLRQAKELSREDLAKDTFFHLKPQYGIAAESPIALNVEANRDAIKLANLIYRDDAVYFSRGMSDKTKQYLLNTPDVRAFSKPSSIRLDSAELPYKIEGNLNRMSLADMLVQASEKEAALAKAPDERFHEFDDGHYWTQLKTQAQREAESDAMGNSTRLPMHDGKDLYSLRDKNGKSILTASRRPGSDRLDELKTRFNELDLLTPHGEIAKGKYLNGAFQPNPYIKHAAELKKKLGLKFTDWELDK